MKVKAFTINPFGENCFVVWKEGADSCLIVDPGMSNDAEWGRVNTFLQQENLQPERVLITHGHSDHVMGTGYVKRDYPQVVICGSVEEQNHLPSMHLQNVAFGVDADIHWLPIEQDVKEGDEFSYPSVTKDGEAASRIEVIDCPGHSHHGLCYYFPDEKIIFTGDVLFYCSIGRSDFGPVMGCDGRLLVEGIVKKLLTLPADVKVFPGHGPGTSIGNEATYNPYF